MHREKDATPFELALEREREAIAAIAGSTLLSPPSLCVVPVARIVSRKTLGLN